MTIHSLDLKTGKRTTQEWTAEELAAHQANAPTVLELWEREMSESDGILPRYAEDIIDVLSPDQLAALPMETKAKYDEKKTKRANKPV